MDRTTNNLEAYGNCLLDIVISLPHKPLFSFPATHTNKKKITTHTCTTAVCTTKHMQHTHTRYKPHTHTFLRSNIE